MIHSNLLSLALLASATSLSFYAVPAWADGDGSQNSPYSGTCSGLDLGTFSEDSTVYIDGITSGYFGASSSQTSFTCVADVNIGSGGMTLTDGYSNATYTFSGSITGNGGWTQTRNSNGSQIAQHYTFTGDVSGYSGNIDYSDAHEDTTFNFGGGSKAATDKDVSGTGSMTINGSLTYNYSGYASDDSTAITIGNSSITALNVQFMGSVDYAVNTTITGTGGTLTISNTGYTTTLNGTVSGINVTVASGATLAVGESGSLNLSGATVDLASAIQNSGAVTIDTSTVFVLDNLTYEGTLTEGATYTLITDAGSGSITVDTTLLGTSNVSSTHEIDSATFNYTDGVLTVTVVELADGLHGDGTIESPYYTSGSSTVVIPVSGDSSIFTGKGTTVYLATDEKSLGNASENVYWTGGDFTAECNIVIGAAGIYLTNGNSGNKHIFTGAISGTGDWTVGYISSSSGVNQDYCFTGDLSQWSGNFSITTSSTSDYVCYGDGKTVAATATNVTGTGAVSVAAGTIAFDYVKEDESGNTGPETVTIGNSLLTAAKFEFVGDVNYIVSADTTITSASSSGSFTVSTQGTVTILGTLTTGDSNAFSSLSVAEGSTLRIGATNTFYMDSTSGTFVISGTLEVAEGVSFTLRKRSAATGYTIANLSLENGSTFTLYTYGTSQPGSSGGLSIGNLTVAGSATMTTNYWQNYVTIGTLVSSGTTGATLTLSSSADSTVATIYELGGSNTESSFTGKIVLSDTNTGDYRGVTLVISDASVAAGAVIEMGAEGKTNGCLALGVNAETVEIAGLVSNNSGGDVVYSGSVSLGATLGNQGATLIDYKGQSGYGTDSKYDGVGVTRNTLVINTAEGTSYSFSGVIMDMLNLEKTGAGTQSIEFKSSTGGSAYYFDGSITVKEGTLNLSGIATNSSGITVNSGATLSISNTITLAESSTSTISGKLTLGESGKLSVGAGATITLNATLGTSNTSGTVEFATGAKLIITDALLESAAITRLDGEEQSIDIIMANTITFGDSQTLSSDNLNDFVANYIEYAGSYDLSWSYADGTLSAIVILPEPSMFGLLFGLGAIGLVATRRRRRA